MSCKSWQLVIQGKFRPLHSIMKVSRADIRWLCQQCCLRVKIAQNKCPICTIETLATMVSKVCRDGGKLQKKVKLSCITQDNVMND